MPQWDFLNFLAEQGNRYPTFRVRMQAEVTGLIEENGRIVGIRGKTPAGPIEVRADLVVGADGRNSIVRDCADLKVENVGASMDSLQVRLSKHPDDPKLLPYSDRGKTIVTIDRGDYWHPIVIAARTILGWQTIISRENNPLDPGVITVGSIHGGTKSNIIPDEVQMQLTVRSYKEDVQKHLLEAINRIAKAEAEAAGAPKPPKVEVSESGLSVYNDPAVTQRVANVLKHVLGEANVVEAPPIMAADDFAEYGHAGVPSLLFFIGAVNPTKFEAAKKNGEILPTPHSPFFAPDPEPSLRTGIEAETATILELLRQK